MGTVKKICIVVSDPITVRAFLNDQIRVLSKKFNVTVVMNHTVDQEWHDSFPGVQFWRIPIVRKVNLLDDLRALWKLYKFFRQQNFSLIHSVTPKAGLLAMTAAQMAGVRFRIHTFTGQVWATRQGASRVFLKTMDRIINWMTSQALVDSPSQRDFLVSENVFQKTQGLVLGSGSISGVDLVKFHPDAEVRVRVRSELGISSDDLIFLFLGRINQDKGILDLAGAFRSYLLAGQEGHLLIVGPDEETLRPNIEAILSDFLGKVHFVGTTKVPQDFMAASDVFCLPSYREGFGSVIIEAASCCLPAIGSRIYGITDAIVADETGFLHEPRDVEQLELCMKRMAADKGLRLSMGEKAQERAKTKFAQGILSQELLSFYRKLLF